MRAIKRQAAPPKDPIVNDGEHRILKSWKEIASYLGIGVRTAQRWKADRGLPVKQPGSGRGSAVLAMSEEIDRWLLDSPNVPREREFDANGFSDILATDRLWNRPSRPRRLEEEVQSLLELGRLITSQTEHAILSKIAAYALSFCKAESSGFSIFETVENEAEIFRWTATRGRMQTFEGGTTPAHFSPCGFCLERNSPQLFRHPEKFYSYLKPISPIAELLLIPMHDDNAWVGTIWVMCHQKRRSFDREDARLMMELGSLASAVIMSRRRNTLEAKVHG